MARLVRPGAISRHVEKFAQPLKRVRLAGTGLDGGGLSFTSRGAFRRVLSLLFRASGDLAVVWIMPVPADYSWRGGGGRNRRRNRRNRGCRGLHIGGWRHVGARSSGPR